MVEMSVKDLLCSWLVGINITLIAMLDCQPRIMFCEDNASSNKYWLITCL